MNNITLHGTVGSDPELLFSQGGKAILKFRLADSHGKDDQKKTMWHNIVVFGKLAENVSNTLNKGDNAIIVGRYEEEEYTNKEGKKAYTRKVIANEVGASCQWTAWVKDASGSVVAQTGMVGKSMNQPMLGDEEPF